MTAMQAHWDIFCRVIDNFGDIGVCWRLARQLAAEHQRQVRLWVDEPPALKALCPALDAGLSHQTLDGVEIRRWDSDFTPGFVADVVIEAFACELPNSYIAAMAQCASKPCWINLEYLTAEAWAEDCHGMASPHPTLPLVKYFFFPGFSTKTGGLLREHGSVAARDATSSERAPNQPLEISLFCYDTAPVGAWLDCLANSPNAVRCYVPPGKPLAAVSSHLGGNGPWQLGSASIEPIPFLSQEDYDHLLWRCDINFVRGEDSFVRAQWGAKPFVWQIYAQEEDAHLVKLETFLERYTCGLNDALAGTLSRMFRAWNDGENIVEAWSDYLAVHDEIAAHNRRWANQLAAQDDLTTALVRFCAAKV